MYVEIWLEKDALAGVVYPVTSMYDVPLGARPFNLPARFLIDCGFGSKGGLSKQMIATAQRGSGGDSI